MVCHWALVKTQSQPKPLQKRSISFLLLLWLWFPNLMQLQAPGEAGAAPAMDGRWFWSSLTPHPRCNQSNSSGRHQALPALFPHIILGREKHSAKGVWGDWLEVYLKLKKLRLQVLTFLLLSYLQTYVYMLLTPSKITDKENKNKWKHIKIQIGHYPADFIVSLHWWIIHWM